MIKIKIKFFVFLTLKRIFKLDRFLFFLFLPNGFFFGIIYSTKTFVTVTFYCLRYSHLFFLPMDGFNCGPKGLSFFSVPSNFFFVLFCLEFSFYLRILTLIFYLIWRVEKKKHFLFQCFFSFISFQPYIPLIIYQ